MPSSFISFTAYEAEPTTNNFSEMMDKIMWEAVDKEAQGLRPFDHTAADDVPATNVVIND
jgi:hypothetical protein